jgi:hypothetical protein
MYKNKINNMENKRLPKLLQTPKITTYDSSGDGIKMPGIG